MFNKNFVLLFSTSIISMLGSSFTYIAIYWTFSNNTTGTNLALLTTAVFLSRFLFFTFLSPFTDRYSPKKLIRITMLMRFIMLSVFSGALYFFQIHIIWIILLMILQTALEALAGPSVTKLMVNVVDKDDLTRANALFGLNDRLGILIGMVLGGILIAKLSLDIVLFIEALGYFIGFLLISGLQIGLKKDEEIVKRRNYWYEWLEGIKYIFVNKWMLVVMSFAILTNLSIAPTVTLLGPYTVEVLRGDSSMFSYLELSSIIGSIITAFILSKWKFKNLNLFYSISIACLVQSITIIFLGLNTNVPASLALLALLGMSVAFFNIPFNTIIQKSVPESLLGRVRSTLVALSTGASSIGYSLTGVVADITKVSYAFLIFGTCGLISILIIMFTLGNPMRVKSPIKV